MPARQSVLQNFIVFEGIDGSGTTTQIQLASQSLRLPHWITKEPTEGEEGRLIRSVLSGQITRDLKSLAYLFAADRNEHLFGNDGIVSHLEKKEIVLCDRYLFSSLVYQGLDCGQKLPSRLNQYFPLPSLLLYLQVDPSVALTRIESRPQKDFYETNEYQEKLYLLYEKVLRGYKKSDMRIAYLDASLDPIVLSGLVMQQILKIIVH